MEWWWLADEVNLIALHLDAPSLCTFSICSRAVGNHLCSPATLRWFSEIRGLPMHSSGRVSSIEHLELAEVMSSCASSIFFGWGSMTIVPSAEPHLRRVASVLSRHADLTLSIEAHCGLEAQYAMPLPGQARNFTRQRAQAVKDALLGQAEQEELVLEGRIKVRAWGCARPLVWCFGHEGMGEPVDEEAAAKNRRVELYLSSGDFEVPRRRKRSEIPQPPGSAPLEDAAPEDGHNSLSHLDTNDNDGTADAGASDDNVFYVTTADGVQMAVTSAMLMEHIQSFDSETDSEAEEVEYMDLEEAHDEDDVGDEETD